MIISPRARLSSLVVMMLVSVSAAAAPIESTFLTLSQTPNSLALLPPPPTASSLDFLADQEAYKQGLRLRKTSRGQQAISDADLSDANLGKPFSQALGVAISQQNTPITYAMLQKIRQDSGDLATRSAKAYYMRVRPFVYYATSSCTPHNDAQLSKNGSYPSGHTAIGWTTALLLVAIRPAQQQELLKRGYEFGQSRVICGAHWQSDVTAGRIMGAADFSRLIADPEFSQQLQAARAEIATKIRAE